MPWVSGRVGGEEGQSPPSQVVQLAADVARRSGDTGRVGVVCQLQSVFAACVGCAQLAQAPFPPRLVSSPCSAPRTGVLWASPCCLGTSFPELAFGAIAPCSGAPWPSALLTASEGQYWVGREAQIAVRAGCAEEPVLEIYEAGKKC